MKGNESFFPFLFFNRRDSLDFTSTWGNETKSIATNREFQFNYRQLTV
jgi:hypothetical protein